MTDTVAPVMGADEFRAALEALGLTQVGASSFLGVGERTARRWAVDGPPDAVGFLLRIMIAKKMKPNGVRLNYGSMPTRANRKRRLEPE